MDATLARPGFAAGSAEARTVKYWCRYVCCLLAVVVAVGSAQALMVGTLPDTPAAHVDANTSASPWLGVGAIIVGSGHYGAVAIAPRHVLTAAHTVSGSVANPTAVRFVVNDGSAGGQGFVAEHIDIFPTYSFPYDDLALVRLVQTLPTSVPRYPVFDSALVTGSSIITLVAYGGSGNGDVGVTVSAGSTVKRVGENTVDMLVSKLDNGTRSSSFYLYDFDGPSGTGAMGGASLGNARETTVASGDSGSPAFVLTATGQRAVAGINSFASPLNSGRPADYKFGQGGGGMGLWDPRFIAWLKDRSGNAIVMASEIPVSSEGDVPLPVWVLGSLMLWLGVVSLRRR